MIRLKGYEKSYGITEEGKLWSFHFKRWISPYIPKNGYSQVILSKKGKTKIGLMHRLVASTFIKNPKNKPCVNHIDGIKTNNKVGNLEWVTYKENMRHSVLYDLAQIDGEKNGNSKLSDKQVNKIRKMVGSSYTEIGRIFGVSRVQVSNIINKRQWNHLK